MGKKIRKKINRFDGGMATSSRAEFESNVDLISHFDIYSDPYKLKPMPGYQEIVNAGEHGINFRGLGGTSTTLYGTGYGRTDWLTKEWLYRVQLTEVSGGTPFVSTVNLANMATHFWDNVNSDGSDIRVTTTSSPGTIVPSYVVEIDTVAKTGTLFVKGTNSDIYIYYGHSSVSVPTKSQGKLGVFEGYIAAYNFDVDDNGYWIDDSGNGYDYEHPNVVSSNETVSTSSGYFGNALDASANLGNMTGIPVGNSFSYSFLYYHAASTGSTIKPTSGVYITTNSSRDVIVYWKLANISLQSATASAVLTNNAWHLITVSVGNTDDINVYVNSTLVHNSLGTTGDGDFTHNTTGNPAVTMGSGSKVDAWYMNRDPVTSSDVSATYSNYFTNNTYWTIGTYTEESAQTATYDGIALYSNSDLISGAWENEVVDGQIIKDSSYYPVLSEVRYSDSSGGFLVSQSDDMNDFIFGATVTGGANTVFDPDDTLLTVLISYLFTGDEAIDKTYYFVTGIDVASLNGTTFNDSAYNAYSNVAISSFNNYLAIGGTRNNKAVSELWDLAGTDPVTFIDFGTGKLRVLGVSGGSLFAGINGFIDDAILSGGKPYFDIRHYTGGSTWQSIYKFECPANYTGLTEDWEQPVSQLKLDTNFGFLFYAKIPNDSTPSTFREGWWAVGRNNITGEYGVSLYLDTSGLGYVEMGHRLGDQYFFIHNKDGSVSRLAVDGTYDETSTLITNKLDDEPNTKKKLQNVEIKTEALPTGQTYTVSVSVDGGAYQTVMTHDTDGAVQKSATQLADSTPLPTGYEFQFKVTSTGGSAAMIELAIDFEFYGV